MIRSWPGLTARGHSRSGQWKSRVIENKIAANAVRQVCTPCHLLSSLNNFGICVYTSICVHTYLCICVFVYLFICVFVLLKTKWRRRQVCTQCDGRSVNQFLSFNCRLWFRQSRHKFSNFLVIGTNKASREIFTNLYWEILLRVRQSAQQQEERVINFPFQINLWLRKLAFPGWSGHPAPDLAAINLINKLQSPPQSSSFLPFDCDRLSNGSPLRRLFYSRSLVNCHLLSMMTPWWKTLLHCGKSESCIYMIHIFIAYVDIYF